MVSIPIDNNVIFVVVVIAMAIVNVSFLKNLYFFFSSKKRIKG
jgi:hypothetical protein